MSANRSRGAPVPQVEHGRAAGGLLHRLDRLPPTRQTPAETLLPLAEIHHVLLLRSHLGGRLTLSLPSEEDKTGEPKAQRLFMDIKRKDGDSE